MLITRDPLVRVAPVEWATMRDRTVVQWDKDDLQDLGLIKIDLLGLGMLSLLREAFALYRRCVDRRRCVAAAERWPRDLALHTIPAGDANDLRDDAARRYDRRLSDRVARAAIDAAAAAAGLFLRHRHAGRDHSSGADSGSRWSIRFCAGASGVEAVTYPHPKLKPVLERTLGVPLFQEQGMRLAIEAAGFSGGEADELRRAMGHKRSRERMQAMRAKLG